MELARRFGPVLASVTIAVALWMVVHNLDRSPARFTVPITYQTAGDVVVLADRAPEVEIQVRATKPKLRALQATSFVVRVRHVPGRFGRELVVLDASDVEAPFGVLVDRVTPSQLWVTYDRRVARELAVEPDIQGQPAAGHEIDVAGVRVRPPRIRVFGPATQFGDRASIRTERLDVSGLRATLRLAHAALMLPDPSFSVEGQSEVEVVVPIRPARMRRVFDDVVVEVLEGDNDVSRPNPRAIRVTVEGDEEHLASLAPSAVRARVDASALEPRGEDYRLEPEIVVDAAECPSCRVVARSQGRVDVSVKPRRGGKRSAAVLPRRVPGLAG